MLPLLLVGCETSKSRVSDDNEDQPIRITPDELEPMRNFVLQTRRVVIAQAVKIEMTPQFFEEQMGMTRDPEFVYRSPVKIEKDGTRIIILRNMNTEQTANLNPDRLPRIYFGDRALEVRAYKEMRIYLINPEDSDRPLFINLTAKGDAKMWVSGRLQHDKEVVFLNSALIWSEEKEEYVHRSSIG